MSRLLVLAAAALALAGCGDIPYRKQGFAPQPECQSLYDQHDDITNRAKVGSEVAESPCWKRSHEARDDYDLLTIEFDDQGWLQGSAELPRPAKGGDYLDDLFKQLNAIYNANRSNGLSLVLFVHGWHNNADAANGNVTQFRWLLRDLAIAERGRRLAAPEEAAEGPRVVGIYVGWRGESVTVPLVNYLTFWDRKNTAGRVAQGSVRELFARLDYFREQAVAHNVRMLTIGHSFGGLITFEALSGDFVRAASRRTLEEEDVTRIGDLVVIVNPAVEGARYEPLMVAGHRMSKLRVNQLPVVIIATSTDDVATKYAFWWAREVSTFWERTDGPQGAAIVKAVGHNPRYTTHTLTTCKANDPACAAACSKPQTQARQSDKGPDVPANLTYAGKLLEDIVAEQALMSEMARDGLNGGRYLCGGMRIQTTGNNVPDNNPFWVVQTAGDIVEDHNDIFNARFVSFIRQMYLAVIAERLK